jgi:hypothetical protein
MEQESAQVGFLIGARGNSKQIGNLQIRSRRTPVESFPDRPQANIRSQDCNRTHSSASVHPVSRERSDSRRTPQRCGGIQPRDIQPVAQDYARSEKADARNDLPCDAKAVVGGSCGECCKHDKHCGACRDQGVGAQAGHPLPPLAFRPDEGPEDQRQSQPNCKVMPKHFFRSVFFLVSLAAAPMKWRSVFYRNQVHFFFLMSSKTSPSRVDFVGGL